MKFWEFFKKIFFTFLSVLIGTFLLVSLLSYNSNDPNLFHDISEMMPVHNLAGTLGANFAAILLYLFGGASLFLIFICAIFSAIFSGFTTFKNEWDRIFGILGFIFSCSILSNLSGIELYKNIYPGGFVGFIFVKNLEFKDPFYNYLLVYSMLLCSLVLIFRFSWIKLFKFQINFIKKFGIWDHLKILAKRFSETYSYGWDFAYLFWNKFYIKPQEKIYETTENIKEILLAAQNNNNLDENNVLLNVSSENIENNFEFNFEGPKEYILPDVNILDLQQSSSNIPSVTERENERRANILQEKLECFGINGKIKSVTAGPVVTLFEYQPTIDTKISNILARENDLALALQAVSLRIIAPIPGKSVVGFEVANSSRKSVLFANGAASKR